MVNLQVNYRGGEFTLSMPTTIGEVNAKYLDEITKHVNVAPNYALIAIAYKVRPIELISSVRQNKNASVGGVAMMIKANSDDTFYKNIALGEGIVIAPSDIALGHTVGVPGNDLTPRRLLELLETNKDLNSKLMGVMTPTYFVDFKIVATAYIHGSIGDSQNVAPRYLNPCTKVGKA
uniref:Uncharacterized protein n=1 Tax=Geladintestivirus 3 TaxID=3233135 RepID=A0AAU8MGZ6_9CAUD